MRIGLQIVIVLTSFAYIMSVIGYVLLIQLNKSDSFMEETKKLINNSPQIIYFDIFIFLVMTGSLAFFIIRFITNPLRKLRDIADKIARGDVNVKIHTKGTNEIRDLAISLIDIRV